MKMDITKRSYKDRIQNHTNPTAIRLLEIMEAKKTNLAVAADVLTKKELLHLAEILGPYICVFKTHIDILTEFDDELAQQLSALSEKHNFLIFEDRKFADIGNTVRNQYEQGVYKIASWSHITNAHPIPGEGIVHGLKQVGLPLGRGLLLLAEMSSAGSLAKGGYTMEAIKMAQRNRDFVFGFIGQNRIDHFSALVPELVSQNDEDGLVKEDFIYMTPGVGLSVSGDSLGQQYRTPQQVICDSRCDVIIVGRGIYKDPTKIIENAQLYREAGWNAYLARTGQL